MSDDDILAAVAEYERTHPEVTKAINTYAIALYHYEQALRAMNPYVIVTTDRTTAL